MSYALEERQIPVLQSVLTDYELFDITHYLLARARLLQISGYNSAQDFISHQNQAIAQDEQATSQ